MVNEKKDLLRLISVQEVQDRSARKVHAEVSHLRGFWLRSDLWELLHYG